MIVIIKEQRGFTLLELMVALAIFAMLAVAGWQVFDSVSRAREQAQVQADHLAVLQQAYLQIQQDLGQIIAYQTLEVQNTSLQNGSDDANNQPANNQNNDNSSSNTVDAKPFMLLDKERLRFIRFADPDPRYQNSPSLQRVEYILSEERLIRRQYVDVRGDSVSLDSVVLEGISAASWQAYLPEISASFPNNSSNTETGNNSTASNGLAQNTPTDMAKSQKALLPKGISISFTYQDIPITWQWALTPQPAPLTSHPIATKSNNDSSNSNNSNSNNSNNNGSNNNGNTSNTSSVNKEVGNDPMGL